MKAARDQQTYCARRSPRGASAAPHRRAFTYVELISVVFIIGILSAIVAPRFFESLSYHRAEAAARRIKTDLDLARRRARTTSASQTVTFLPNADSYSLNGVDHMDHVGLAYEVDISAVPYEASIVSADFGGDAVLVFDGYGVPDSAGQVVVQAGETKRTVSVDAETGRATIQ